VQQVKECLFIELEKESYHQHIKIDGLEIRIHYNYLLDVYFLSAYGDDEHLASNIPIFPNIDLFSGLRYKTREKQFIGSLFFNFKNKDNIKKDDLFNSSLDVIYFSDVYVMEGS
jgi:hypothetical protein